MPEPSRKADPSVPSEAEAFYVESLRHLKKSGVPFLVAGTYAVNAHTGLDRSTKDLDVFCRPGDYPRVLALFRRLGFETEVEDERWIAKVWRGEYFFDVIFNSTNAIAPVNEHWFEAPETARIHGIEVPILGPTELIWSKAFIQDRSRYDGADIAHVILKQHALIDWQRLLSYMDQYWEVLLVHVLNFRFIYPTERDLVPRWLVDELVTRLKDHADLPAPNVKDCRGRLFSRSDYVADITEWGFADVVGEGERRE